MNILYQDKDLWVVVKPPAQLSESSPDRQGLADQLSAQNNGYAGVVHRLDRGVGGIMVYAKTSAAAAKLSAAVAERRIQKEYFALVQGEIAPSGILEDLLFFDRVKNKSFVVDRPRKGVKDARLSYRVEETAKTPEYGPLHLLTVQLYTGRTHQIRVQLAHLGHPLLGDRKYGSPIGGGIGLFSHKLAFPHPRTGAVMSFSHTPTGERWELFHSLQK